MQRSINPEDIFHSLSDIKIVIETMPESTTYYIGTQSSSPVDVIDVLFSLETIDDSGGHLPFRVVAGDGTPYDSRIADLLFPLVRALILASDPHC